MCGKLLKFRQRRIIIYKFNIIIFNSINKKAYINQRKIDIGSYFKETAVLFILSRRRYFPR